MLRLLAKLTREVTLSRFCIVCQTITPHQSTMSGNQETLVCGWCGKTQTYTTK